jgi:Zn-dependent peptidase ImmA (M78 family)
VIVAVASGLTSTIAHELAHVFRHATLPTDRYEDTTTSEIETNRIAKSWVFSQKPFSQRAYRKELAFEQMLKQAEVQRLGMKPE